MSRGVAYRWELTGDLVAESPVHIGGVGDGPPDLLQVRDGLNRPVLPGTSLAGALQAALNLEGEEERLWRPTSPAPHVKVGDAHDASWVLVDDAPADQSTTEIRDHVSIDRIHGTAARGHLFTREVLPAGTRFAFRMVIDEPSSDSANPPAAETAPSAAERLAHRVAALLCGPGIALGAAVTTGLGRVRLQDARLRRFGLSTRAGMVATLRGQGELIQLPEPVLSLPVRRLRVVVPWRSCGPLMVQVPVEGAAVDTFPLTTRGRDGVRLELPGSSIKGVLRSHAERIVRTVVASDELSQSKPREFLEQIGVGPEHPIAVLFGTAGEQASGEGAPRRRGALWVSTCVSDTVLPPDLWDAVRHSGYDIAEAEDEKKSEDELRRAALGRLAEAVRRLNQATDGFWFTVAPHVAIDRWTGGAATGRLFASLEAHATRPGAWRPIELELRPGRCSEPQLTSALALLVLVLRDLCEGWVGFGHGTTRGTGGVIADPAEVRFHADADWQAEWDGRSLADILADGELMADLSTAWSATIDRLTAEATSGGGDR